MTRVRLTVPVDVAAPAEVVWRTVTDWERQGEWIPATRVEVTSEGTGRGLGATLSAVTGFGPLAFADPMEIVEWSGSERAGSDGAGSKGTGPYRCVVRHLGRVVRGDGVFEVVALAPDRSVFLWTEELDLPLGALGRVGWTLLRPAFRAGVALALRRLAHLCEAEYGARA